MVRDGNKHSHASGKYQRSWASGARTGDAVVTRVSKRRWAGARHAVSDGAHVRAQAGGANVVSRFAFGATARPTERNGGGGGDWQRRVSSVPRPSATPERMRRVRRRSVPSVTPMGSTL